MIKVYFSKDVVRDAAFLVLIEVFTKVDGELPWWFFWNEFPVVWFLGSVGSLDGDCGLCKGVFSWGNAQLLHPGAGCLAQGGTHAWDGWG